MNEFEAAGELIKISVPAPATEVQPGNSTWNLWLDVGTKHSGSVWVLEKDDQVVHRSEDLAECTDLFRNQSLDGDVILGGLFTLAIENDPKPYEAWPKEEPLPFPDNETLRSWGA